jgi:hypothetical protein
LPQGILKKPLITQNQIFRCLISLKTSCGRSLLTLSNPT